ncbi:protein tyrosine kinase 7 (inactive) [Homo sapiens]|uniref:Protein tyrosine kinase 7 (inactive) n=1 Tax=Homo sapiens TaxID=9606 RepID=F8WCI7_HUMAN|nr:protein tyrosine kinase 7 (inactive) [Homo sapiens]KAI4018386.1 protein tyrosine kinase 7 (inactive) [Homo sapiens]
MVARVSGLIVTLLSSSFPGGPLQNGQPSAEIQEEVALTSLGSGPAATNKRHSTSDKMHFPRSSLQPITTLGRPQAVPEDFQEQG